MDQQRELERQRVAVGTLINLLKEYNDIVERKVVDKSNQHLEFLLAGKNTEIIAQRDLIWDIDRYSSLSLTCDPDYFLEALASNIKGSVISFQTWVRKTENKEKARIISYLNYLKNDYENNASLISEQETIFRNILDTETLLKVRSMKLFSCLNEERPTPLFLSLARSSNKGTNLSGILKDDGSPFLSEGERIEGVVSYFERIYKKDVNACDYNNCIEKFLGEEILNSPVVSNSNLTPVERNELDCPLTIDELDESLEKCNIRSAPGIDGLSNAFIKKYWQYFRVPLFNYANDCFLNPTLPGVPGNLFCLG